jgi:hypothetical protein
MGDLEEGQNRSRAAADRDHLVAVEWITTQLSDHQDPEVRRLGRLTSLRLLDILAWMLGDS